MEGKVTKASINSMVEYTSGTDGNLTNPLSSPYGLEQDSCFIPMCYSAESELVYIAIGDYQWEVYQAPGPNKIIVGLAAGNAYGTIKLTTQGGGVWYYFADAQYNGTQRIWLPKTVNDDKEGGYFDFYYHRGAWYNAFNGASCDIYPAIITLDGSVYKGSVTLENLVVSGAGIIGKAGGGNHLPFASAVQSSRGDISSEVISISKHGEHILI